MWSSPGPTTAATSGTGWTVALYVRDALDLPFSADIPRLEPPVARRPDRPTARAITAEAWDGWLRALSDAPAGSIPPPAHDPVLHDWYDLLQREARDWEGTTVRTDPYMPSWGPVLLAQGGDRGVRGLVHQIEIVPVAGRWHMSLRPDRLLVSVATWSDADEMDRLVEPRVRAVLRLE